MRKYRMFVRNFLSGWAKKAREERKLTQEKMAERLTMSVRSYADLERGKSGFSATTLLFFLSELPEEQAMQIVREFREGVRQVEEHEAA